VQRVLPTWPVSAQNDPERSFVVLESRSFDLPLQHQDLLTQSKVFEQQVAMGTKNVSEVVCKKVKHWDIIGLKGLNLAGYVIWMKRRKFFPYGHFTLDFIVAGRHKFAKPPNKQTKTSNNS